MHHLAHDALMVDQALVARHGHSARTLVKDDALTLTIIAIGAGGDLPVHGSAGPVTINIISGEVVFTARGEDFGLKAGDLLVIAPNVEHSAKSAVGGVFLLTVVKPAAATPASAS